jgi:LAO/AO transport system kinase
VIVETVGVGQAEFEIASLADTTVLLLAPGLGDGIQAAKAGILEIADIFVVNKADRDGADQVARDLRYMQSLGGRHSEPGAWRPPIVKTVASRGEGVEDVLAALAKHQDWMQGSGELARRRQARAAAEIEAIALGLVRARLGDVHGSAALQLAAARVVNGRTDPYAAAEELVAAL